MKLMDWNTKAREDARSWKGELAKANVKVGATVVVLQKVMRDLQEQQVSECKSL
jgi:hypothetical protein